jgi:hypothetical protein
MEEEVTFTESELATLEGRDLPEEGPDAPPVVPEPEPIQFAEPEVEEQPAQAETDSVDVDKLKRANAGLINEVTKLRKQGRDDREWRAAIEARMETLQSVMQPQPAADIQEQVPDKDEDPLAYLEWTQKQYIDEKLKPVQELEQQAQEEQQYTQMLQEAGRLATQAEKDLFDSGAVTRDEYNQKLDTVRWERMKWYMAGGSAPQEAAQIVQEEERQFVFAHLAEGNNPAAEILKLYEGLGLKPAEKPQATGPTIQKVQQVQAGAAQGKMGGVTGTGSPGGVITFEQFSNMDPEDPIFKRIAGDERLFQEVNIYGKVSLPA